MLTKWHGYDGSLYNSSEELMNAIDNREYKGEWFIPTEEIIRDNLSKNTEEGDLRDTFAADSNPGRGRPGWYWSSKLHSAYSERVWSQKLSEFDNGAWVYKEEEQLSTRLVRAELR